LAFIANVCGNHWVAVVVDMAVGVLWYGDPMGERIDGELEAALQWWSYTHLHTTFTFEAMLTPKQQDHHSCGVLAYVALWTFILLQEARD
jgi:hypothetical protein